MHEEGKSKVKRLTQGHFVREKARTDANKCPEQGKRECEQDIESLVEVGPIVDRERATQYINYRENTEGGQDKDEIRGKGVRRCLAVI